MPLSPFKTNPRLNQAEQTDHPQLGRTTATKSSSVSQESRVGRVSWSDPERADDGVVVEPGGPVVVTVLVRVQPLLPVVPGVQDDVRHQLHDLLVVRDY